MSTSRRLRKDSLVYLLGNYSSQIIGNKLPSKKQVLSVLFFNLREVKLNVHESAKLVINEAIVFWNKARIPTQDVQHCVKKLEYLYEEWRSLQKSSHKVSATVKQKEASFINKLEDLFDIAHANALKLIKIKEDKDFLLNQRKKGRPGFMYGIDKNLAEKEKMAETREQRTQERLKKSFEVVENVNILETIESSSSSSHVSSPYEEEIDRDKPGPSRPKKRRVVGTKNIITPKIVAAFDKCKISDRDAVHILSAAAEALGHDVLSLSISRTTIQRCRQKLRKERAEKVKQRFKEHDLLAPVVHWDGKIFADLTGSEKHDRLAVIVTSGDTEQILGIPILQNSTGREQATAVYEALMEWNLHDKVIALCCDTTASNLGHLNGASILLEQMLERDLLYLPCRHHIAEIILRSAFDVKMPSSSGPNVPLFKRFKEAWPKINQSNYKSGLNDEYVNLLLQREDFDMVGILNFVETTLHSQQPRDDYREFLHLTQLFLGKIDVNFRIRAPGAFHHARWMAKAIYCIKIFLFRDEFKITAKEKKSISDICIFIVKVYVKAWFTAPFSYKAPYQDLCFAKNLINYKTIDPAISQATVSKIKNHLWYLTPEACALSFFDDEISVEGKNNMVKALKKGDSLEECDKRIKLNDINELENKEIWDFISYRTINFFKRFGLSTDFLNENPLTWGDNAQYETNFNVVRKIKVVNDTAERGIKLIDEYNNILTKDEEQRQFILQIVSEYRTQFTNINKDTITKAF